MGSGEPAPRGAGGSGSAEAAEPMRRPLYRAGSAWPASSTRASPCSPASFRSASISHGCPHGCPYRCTGRIARTLPCSPAQVPALPASDQCSACPAPHQPAVGAGADVLDDMDAGTEGQRRADDGVLALSPVEAAGPDPQCRQGHVESGRARVEG